MSDRPGTTIVEYFDENEGHKCGYCKGKTTSFSQGMWAHQMTVQDYQDLVDRGWRRSGCYCYKPSMKITCCPQYPIRCKATELRLTHSQKKVLKKVKTFLMRGKKPGDSKSHQSQPSHADYESTPCEIFMKDVAPRCGEVDINIDSSSASTKTTQHEPLLEKIPMKKAKLRRMERNALKLNAATSEVVLKTRKKSEEKTLEEYFEEASQPDAVHHLEIKLIRSSPPSEEFERTLQESHELYVKYQVNVHQDKPEKCSLHQYQRFLVNSPLKDWKPADGPPEGYGSFHQHYRLDGKLVAVAVLDILPSCISSVYFYYDPDYSFLSLGTYSSLREIGLVRELSVSCPDLCWYYLGFYIHSCPKMRYKGQYHPSDLACPETYRWVPISDCIPKLEQNKYSRLVSDGSAKDEDGTVLIDDVMVLYKRQAMPYGIYRAIKKKPADEDEVKDYAGLVGMKCAERMLLYRS